MKTIRCAIYTRKSSEEGLDQGCSAGGYWIAHPDGSFGVDAE